MSQGEEPFDPTEDAKVQLGDFPLVICTSEGGPFDDESFIVGLQCGGVEILAGLKVPIISATVDDRALPFIDLIAMNNGYRTYEDHATGIDGAVRVTLYPDGDLAHTAEDISVESLFPDN